VYYLNQFTILYVCMYCFWFWCNGRWYLVF